MKILYLDCSMGAAGDMLTAALSELFPDKKAIEDKLNSLGIPKVHFAFENVKKCGICGTHVSVTIDGEEEHEHHHNHDHEHHHDHDHEHHHDHAHTTLHDIEHITEHMDVPQRVRENVMKAYGIIADAESHSHGVPVDMIHFHEVGDLDAIADITAVCLLMDMLDVDKVVCSPVHVGAGTVHCAHGILPVPAPATAHILRDVPIYGGKIQAELCTPTGAALLKLFVDEFSEMPLMRTKVCGYGCGKKDFETANCVRAMLGETDGGNDFVYELSCNMDDMTAEDLAFATEVLLNEGARDVFTVPVGMKKSRQGILLCVICDEKSREKMIRLIFRHTSTIGIREQKFRRYVLDRHSEECESRYGSVRMKISEGYGVKRIKPEHDDIVRIAKETGMSADEVKSHVHKQHADRSQN